MPKSFKFFQIIIVAIILSISSLPVSAKSNTPINSVSIKLSENIPTEQEITLPDGTTGTLGIEPITNGVSTRIANNTYKIYWYSGSINTHFFIKVVNNTITRAYDEWYLTIGPVVKSANLRLNNSKQATYSFQLAAPYDIFSYSAKLLVRIQSNNTLYTYFG